MTLLLSLLLPAAACAFHPAYSPQIANSVQQWDVTTLREQIKQKHVKRLAFYSEGDAVEVLDINGIQRRVAIFPAMESQLVQDMRQAEVPFFVAPERGGFPPMVVAYARAFVLTLIVIAAIDALGMMDEFIFGCMIIGNALFMVAADVDAAFTSAFAAATKAQADARSRMREALGMRPMEPENELVPLLIEQEDDRSKPPPA